jgi:hypothetical protein
MQTTPLLESIHEALLRDGWIEERGKHYKLTPPWHARCKLIMSVTSRSRRGALNLRSTVRKMYAEAGRECPV